MKGVRSRRRGGTLTAREARALPVLVMPGAACAPLWRVFDDGPTSDSFLQQRRNLCLRCPLNTTCDHRRAVR